MDFILRESGFTGKLKILDSACGFGRHSLRFGEKGHSVTAFDLSRRLLEAGFSKINNNSPRVDFFVGDIRDIPLKTEFDLITSLFTSFGYFDSDEENFRFFRNVHKLLRKEGLFVLDYFNSEYVVKNLISDTRVLPSGNTVIQHRYLLGQRVIKEIIIANPAAEDKKFTESVRLFSPDELISELKRKGFLIGKLFGDYEGANFDGQNSPRLIIFCRR